MIDTLQKFFQFCSKENRRKFYKSIFMAVVAALFGGLKIPAIAVLIRAILEGRLNTSDLFLSLGIMLISVLGMSIIKYHATMLQTEAGYGTAADKRMEIAEHMRYMPMGYFNENSLGSIMSVTTNTMENLSDVGTRVVMMVTEGIMTTSVITLMVFIFDWRIGLIIVAGLVIYYLMNTLLQKKSHDASVQKVYTDSLLVEKVLEYIKGILEVKAYHLSGKYNERLEQAIEENVQANIGMELTLIPFMSLQNFVAKFIGVAVAAISIYFYTRGSMSLLNCIMMAVCSFMLMEGLESAGNYSSLLRVINLCVDKASAILNVKPMDIAGENMEPNSYELKADHISFSYGEKKIIDDISLTIPQNTTTAIVGPSGSGKTTLCHLLSRFWDVDEGMVTLGGKDVRKYSLDALMKNFSFVFQDVYLFQDTVANNIRFGQPDASMDDVIAAAKKAKCHEFIKNLPNGYETIIGESGGTLSGGEKQRLSIARAMMKNAPIIILDEATANVDPENESNLLDAISELTKNKTIIMIAHRLKTVRNADQILVVDEGKIVQQGTHDELMEEEGIYRNFVEQRNLAVSWKL